MVGDVASGSIPWRNADAAAAALFIATSSDHNVFTWLQDIEKTDVPGHRELALAAKAIRERDIKTLKSLAAPPPATSILSHHDDRYRVIKKLWDAASRAEDLPM